MGNAPSNSSEDEAAAAGGEGWSPHQDWAADSGTTPGPGPAAAVLPSAAALLEPARLREAAAALRPAPPCESLVSRHHGALLRWLEERLGRGEESVTLEQFRELLEARGAGCSGEQFEEVRAGWRLRGGSRVVEDKILKRWAVALRRPARKPQGPWVLRMGCPNPFGVHHSGILLRPLPFTRGVESPGYVSFAPNRGANLYM